MLKAIRDGVFAASYCALIYWLSDQPSIDMPSLFAYQDKVHHAGAYALMAILAWRFFRHLISDPFSIASIALVFSSVFGLTDELHQALIPFRAADWLDWFADTIGAGVSTMAGYYIIRRPIAAQQTQTTAPRSLPNDEP
ncbi:MAG: VanZ family protein [Pseudomonadota bacterium]